MAKRQNIPALITQIGHEQGLSPAQIRAMIATSKQESGWDPNAIGDNGSSYGLFQHHVGGAGGSSHDSANDYLNPVKSITERAKWFKKNNIRGGTGAAALQRPANPSGYAHDVDAILSGLGKNVGAGSPGEATVSPSAGTGGAGGSTLPAGGSDAANGPSWADNYLAEYLYKDDPLMRGLFSGFLSKPDPVPAAPMIAGTSQSVTPNQPSNYKGGKLKDYRDLVKLGKQYGLALDGGNGQTTGGSHTAGSKHYSNKAVDFGDAKNSPDKLRTFAKFLSQNSGSLGIDEVAYNPLGWGMDQGKRIPGMTWEGHNDHLHVGLR